MVRAFSNQPSARKVNNNSQFFTAKDAKDATVKRSSYVGANKGKLQREAFHQSEVYFRIKAAYLFGINKAGKKCLPGRKDRADALSRHQLSFVLAFQPRSPGRSE
jgi:hypothetical protein